MRERIVYRSAITGQFVSREYAEAHPDTTIRQVVRVRSNEVDWGKPEGKEVW